MFLSHIPIYSINMLPLCIHHYILLLKTWFISWYAGRKASIVTPQSYCHTCVIAPCGSTIADILSLIWSPFSVVVHFNEDAVGCWIPSDRTQDEHILIHKLPNILPASSKREVCLNSKQCKRIKLLLFFAIGIIAWHWFYKCCLCYHFLRLLSSSPSHQIPNGKQSQISLSKFRKDNGFYCPLPLDRFHGFADTIFHFNVVK